MAFDITQFRANLNNDGARNTLFQVQLINPVDSAADIKSPFLIQAAALPGSNIGVIPVAYFGRRVKIPGDRTFNPWQVVCMNDEDFAVRDKLEKWMNSINSLKGNIRTLPSSSPTEYQSTAIVTQFSKEGKALREYQFSNLWPSVVGDIELSWNAENQIEVFPVTLQYDYYEVLPGVTSQGLS